MKTLAKTVISILIIIVTFIVVLKIRSINMPVEKTLVVVPKQPIVDTTDEDKLESSDYNQAVMYYDKQNYDEAQKILSKLSISSSNYAQAHFLLGKVSELQGLYTDMRTKYEQYLKIKPKGIHSEYAKLRLAQLYIRSALSSKEHKDAYTFMKAAEQYLVTLDQMDENVKIALAVVYINVGNDNRDYRDIIEKFEKSDVNSTTDKKIRYNVLGLAYAKVKEFKKASKMFESAVADEPNNKYAHNNLGYAYANLGELEKAKLHLMRALELDRDYGKAQKNLALVEAKIEKKMKRDNRQHIEK
jgi:tetratricopeptide (TPR) repeat protein